MRDRLKRLRKNSGLTQTEFGKKIGLTDGMVSFFESGIKIPKDGTISLICLTFGVREEWLREGTGEMFDEEALFSADERRLLELFRRLSPTACRMLIEYAEKLLADEAALRGDCGPEADKKPDRAARRRENSSVLHLSK